MKGSVPGYARIIAGLCIFLGCLGASAAFGKVRVVKLSPAPNYGACHDPQAAQELTDGTTASYPLWIRPGCVGWQDSGPIKIFLHIDAGREQTISGLLSIHTARGVYAGVEVPARIDVYYQGREQQYFHAAGETLQAGSFADLQNHWVTIAVDHTPGDLLVIVRPNGSYFTADQISWTQGSVSSSNHELVGAPADCIADSQTRYQQSLSKSVVPAQTASGWAAAFGNGALKAWVVENPWDVLPVYPEAATIAQASLNLHLFGTGSDVESACLGILNPGNSNQPLSLSFSGQPGVISSLSIRQVSKILAANGAEVYDPLLPVNGGRLTAMGQQASYVWIQADMRRMPQGLHSARLLVRNRSGAVVAGIPISLNVIDARLPDSCLPAAVNWAYTNDLPIWSRPGKCMADLLDHGVNVFVVHPSFVPQPSLEGSWDGAKAQELAKQLQLFKGKGRILLYLGWNNGPGWLDPANPQSVTAHQDVLGSWVKRLCAFMKVNRLAPSQWALYPLDEPCGANIPFLVEVAKCVRQADPTVQIYADPTTYSSCVTTADELEKLVPYVNIWQPNVALATGAAKDFFANLGSSWWVYWVPPSPAKAGSPWTDYLLKVVWAWASGARGVGFWSYSSTNGTSAWQDFDGPGPDFAVVYESAKGPVGSRRWEAFRKGVEDFQLFESVRKMDLAAGKGLEEQVESILEAQPVSFTAMESLREELLSAVAATRRPIKGF
jgi:hypothetical protein